jgi:hypothetical protein
MEIPLLLTLMEYLRGLLKLRQNIELQKENLVSENSRLKFEH